MKLVYFSSALVAATLAAADCSASSKPLKKLQHDVTDPARFCDFWLKDPSKSSPFKDLKPAALSKVCDCVKASPTIVTSGPTPTAKVGKVRCSADNEAVQALEDAVSDPTTFCSWWFTSERKGTSPFAKLGDKKISSICQCAQENPDFFGGAPSTTTSSGSAPTSTGSCYAQVSGFTNCQDTPAGSFGSSSSPPLSNGYVAGCEDRCDETDGCAFVFAEIDSGAAYQNCHFYTAVPTGYTCKATDGLNQVTEGLKKKKTCS